MCAFLMHFSRLQLAHCNIEDRWEEDERVGGWVAHSSIREPHVIWLTATVPGTYYDYCNTNDAASMLVIVMPLTLNILITVCASTNDNTTLLLLYTIIKTLNIA